LSPNSGRAFGEYSATDTLEQVAPAIIGADNDSTDDTYNFAPSLIKTFPTPLRVLRVVRPGQSTAINAAVGLATSDILAFLDDDVVVEWRMVFTKASIKQDKEYSGYNRRPEMIRRS